MRRRPDSTSDARRLVALLGLICSVAAIAAVFAPPAMAVPLPDSKGTEFWLAFPNNAARSPTLTLFITGDEATSGTVAVSALEFTESFTVTPGTVTPVVLPDATQLPAAGIGASVHVTAASEVTVYGLSRSPATTDAYLGLPVDVLGTEHIVMAWGVGAIGGSEFAVAASQNDTTVTITPASATTDAHAAGTPYTVSLNRGQSYLTISTGGDLTGSVVSSDKPVAVFGGHVCANIPDINVFACDHVVEQQPPNEAWGKDFLTVPLKTRLGGDTFRFLASQDATQVTIDGTVAATLDAGEFHTQLIVGSAVVSANQPILVAQYSNGTSFDNVTSDPFMMLIPPHEQFQSGYTVSTPPSGFSINAINLVVPERAVGVVQVDGTAVPSSEYTAIGSSGFSGAQVDVTLGSHTVTATGDPFGVFAYGFDQADSYGYPGGLTVAPIASVTSVTLAPESQTHQVNTEGCVTATVGDQRGNPLAGVRVDFVATATDETSTQGPVSGSQNTEADGRATFCYTRTQPGTDRIVGSVGRLSGSATKTWTTDPPPPPPAVSIESGPAGVVLDPSPTFTFRSDAPGVTFECRVDSAAFSSCTSPFTTGDLAPGDHVFEVRALNAGIAGAPARRTFTVGAPATAPPPAPPPPPPPPPPPSPLLPVSVTDRDKDGIPDAQDTSDASVGPTLAKTVVAEVVSGTVLVKYPAGFMPRSAPTAASGFVPLKGAEIVPIGSQVDARGGRLALTSVASGAGAARKTQAADFYKGIFQIKQARATKPVTELVLDKSAVTKQCGSSSKGASAAAAKRPRSSKKVVSQLWGNGKGNFRTRGRNSTATVRGTIWLTQERCDGTFTRVQQGSVTVRDLRAGRTITVRAGRGYLARATRAAAKRKP